MRELTRDEVELLWTIDRREVHHHVYRVQDGELVLTPNYFDVPGWPLGTVEEETPKLYECFDCGGTFLGVFDGDTVVGIAVVEARKVGRDADQLPLAYLYVSRDYRGRGIATQLFDAADAIARDSGAKAMYVSATRTQNTVDFYLHRGCVLTPEPDPGLFAAEPEDIHLLYPL